MARKGYTLEEYKAKAADFFYFLPSLFKVPVFKVIFIVKFHIVSVSFYLYLSSCLQI